jgi:hypothetical protein
MGKQSNRIMKELTKFVESEMTGLTNTLTIQLAEDNPIDTGFSGINWIPQIGAKFSGTAGTYEQAADGILNIKIQQSAIANVMSSYKLRSGPIYISNNADYIEDLNDGSSSQAPAGFVQIAIAKSVKAHQRMQGVKR